MSNGGTLREWLESHTDDLAATVFAAVVVASLVGFRRRSTGAASFVSACYGAMMAIIIYPVVSAYGYGWQFGLGIVGPLCGALAWAIIGVLTRLSDRVDERSTEIADKIIDKGEQFIPGRRDDRASNGDDR